MPFITFGSVRINPARINYYHVLPLSCTFVISFGEVKDQLRFSFDTEAQAAKCLADFEALLA